MSATRVVLYPQINESGPREWLTCLSWWLGRYEQVDITSCFPPIRLSRLERRYHYVGPQRRLAFVVFFLVDEDAGIARTRRKSIDKWLNGRKVAFL